MSEGEENLPPGFHIQAVSYDLLDHIHADDAVTLMVHGLPKFVQKTAEARFFLDELAQPSANELRQRFLLSAALTATQSAFESAHLAFKGETRTWYDDNLQPLLREHGPRLKEERGFNVHGQGKTRLDEIPVQLVAKCFQDGRREIQISQHTAAMNGKTGEPLPAWLASIVTELEALIGRALAVKALPSTKGRQIRIAGQVWKEQPDGTWAAGTKEDAGFDLEIISRHPTA